MNQLPRYDKSLPAVGIGFIAKFANVLFKARRNCSNKLVTVNVDGSNLVVCVKLNFIFIIAIAKENTRSNHSKVKQAAPTKVV